MVLKVKGEIMLINGMDMNVNDEIKITEEWIIPSGPTSCYEIGHIKKISSETQDEKVFIEVSLESGFTVRCCEDKWVHSTQSCLSIKKEKVTVRVEKVNYDDRGYEHTCS